LPVALICSAFLLPRSFSQDDEPRTREISIRVIDRAALGVSTYGPMDSTATMSTRDFRLTHGDLRLSTPQGRSIALRFTAKQVTLERSGQLREFLGRNGILPDANATSTVYDLNPYLATIQEIAPGTQLRIPALEIVSETESPKLPMKPVIALINDGTLKANLREALKRFRTILNKKQKTLSPDAKRGLTEVDQAFSAIEGDQVPSSHEMLGLAAANLATLLEMLNSVTPKSSEEFTTRLMPIKAAVSGMVEAAQRGNPDVPVTVHTWKDGEEVSRFKVCYVEEGLYRQNCASTFYKLSSPTTQLLTQGVTYMFWATEPDNEAKAISDTRKLNIRRQGQQLPDLDLTLVK